MSCSNNIKECKHTNKTIPSAFFLFHCLTGQAKSTVLTILCNDEVVQYHAFHVPLLTAQNATPRSSSTSHPLRTLRSGPCAHRDECQMGTKLRSKGHSLRPALRTCHRLRSLHLLVIMHASLGDSASLSLSKVFQILVIPCVSVDDADGSVLEKRHRLPHTVLRDSKITSLGALPEISKFERLFRGRTRFGTSESYSPR